LSADGLSLVVKSRSEKVGWDAVATWTVTADGKMQERHNVFKSKSLNKEFIIRYEREV
jgi:hypothetical protein